MILRFAQGFRRTGCRLRETVNRYAETTHNRIQLYARDGDLRLDVNHFCHRRGDGFISRCTRCRRRRGCGEGRSKSCCHGCCGHIGRRVLQGVSHRAF